MNGKCRAFKKGVRNGAHRAPEGTRVCICANNGKGTKSCGNNTEWPAEALGGVSAGRCSGPRPPPTLFGRKSGLHRQAMPGWQNGPAKLQACSPPPYTLCGSKTHQRAQKPLLLAVLAQGATVTLAPTLIKTEYWDREGGDVGHACNSRMRKKVGACHTISVRFNRHGAEMHNHWKFETLVFRVGLR